MPSHCAPSLLEAPPPPPLTVMAVVCANNGVMVTPMLAATGPHYSSCLTHAWAELAGDRRMEGLQGSGGQARMVGARPAP